MKEKIYDKEIAPLMETIIEVCKRNGIPMFSDFQLTEDDNDGNGPMFCTTCINSEIDWCDKEINVIIRDSLVSLI